MSKNDSDETIDGKKIMKFSSTTSLNEILSEEDINNLFLGFVRLIKRSVVIERERQYKSEINYYNKRLNEIMMDIDNKNKEIAKLNKRIKNLTPQR